MQRLSVRMAASRVGTRQQTITDAMDLWVSSRGKAGLSHVEVEAAGSRRQRWTTERWILEWQDREARRMASQRTPTSKWSTSSSGLVTGDTKEFLKQAGFYE